MTVRELIEKLQGYSPDLRVLYLDSYWGAIDIEVVEEAQKSQDSYVLPYYNFVLLQ